MVLSDKDNDFFNQMEARPRGRGQIERYGGLQERALLALDCCLCHHPKCPTLTFGTKSITPNVHMTQTVGGVGSHVAVGVTGGDVLVRGGSPVVKGPGIGPSKAFWALFAVEGPSAGPSTTAASPLIAICFRGDAGRRMCPDYPGISRVASALWETRAKGWRRMTRSRVRSRVSPGVATLSSQ